MLPIGFTITFCLMQINGINLKTLPARDAYAYALCLMDALFTQEEMAVSLLFASKRSSKTALDRLRVEKILGKLSLRFHNTHLDFCLGRGDRRGEGRS